MKYAARRTSFIITNDGAVTVYIGPNNQVTVTNGYPIYAGESVEFSPVYGDDTKLERFAIAEVAGVDVRIEEEYE